MQKLNTQLAGLIFFFVSMPSLALSAQEIQRISFDKMDSSEGYYLAIMPQSKKPQGVILLITSFLTPENLLSETKLHSVAYTNDLLTIVAPMKQKLYADQFAVDRINTIIDDLKKRYSPDLSKIAIAGYDEAGNIALRYTELCYESPAKYPIQPKAVFAIDSPVDLFGLWHWSERQIKKNFWPGAVGDAKYYLETMTKEHGTIDQNAKLYKALTPFERQGSDSLGNEQFLKNVALRLYYDVDIEWQLANRRNSFYDTKLPDGSELVSRLLLMGNQKAEFIASKKQGLRNNGTRHPTSISIVDEVDCIHWLKRSLGIFDPLTWTAPYRLNVPKGWSVEHFALPADFAASMTLKGIEDIRFAPGWGDSKEEDYWSYAYLWWLQGNPQITADILEKNLLAYYSGLVNRNIEERKIPQSKLIPTTAKVKKLAALTGDVQTFTGEIKMLDYMTRRPMVLNIMVHVKACEGTDTPVLIKVSPKTFSDSIWQDFRKLEQSFSCP